MTSSLPTPAKSPASEGARLDLGNFFQTPAASAANSSKPDFESLLPKRQTENPSDEARDSRDSCDSCEEREAAKARKKPVEVALVTPTVTTGPAPTPENLDPTASPQQNNQTPEATASETPAAPPSQAKSPETSERASSKESSSENDTPVDPEAAAAADLTGEAPVSDEKSPTKPESKQSSEESPLAKEARREARMEKESNKSDANGMETAPLDSEMISLATIDGIESGSMPLREPSINSIHRLTAFAASADRSIVSPIAGSSGSLESGLGNLASGSANPLENRQSSSSNPTAQASALFKSLGLELEKFRQTGRSQIQLELPVGETETVRIRLTLRAGELRSTFITESPELREALQKAWPEFAQSSRERGFRLGDPAFQQSYQGNDSASGQNENRRDRSFGSADASLPAVFSTPRKASTARTSSDQPSTALWA